MSLYVAAENIRSGTNVVLGQDGRAHAAGANARSYGSFLGVAIEDVREGFRVAVKDGTVREDDA